MKERDHTSYACAYISLLQLHYCCYRQPVACNDCTPVMYADLIRYYASMWIKRICFICFIDDALNNATVLSKKKKRTGAMI